MALVQLHFGSKSGGTKGFGIGTSIDWNLNCSKLSVPKYRSCGTFDIFGSSPTNTTINAPGLDFHETEQNVKPHTAPRILVLGFDAGFITEALSTL